MQLKKPTYEQRKILNKNNCDTREWFVKKVYKTSLLVENIKTGEERELPVIIEKKKLVEG